MSKKIFANNNPDAYATVDDDIFEIIQDMGLKFCVKKDGYWLATKWIKLPGIAEKKHLSLHHFVWLLKTGEEPILSVDHIDRNRTNNQFENLRLATRQQQNRHRGKQKSNTSGYIGVSREHRVDKYKNKTYEFDYWYSSIHNKDGKIKAKRFPFTDEGKIEAAKYYDKKAIEYHGDFCGELNFPDDN